MFRSGLDHDVLYDVESVVVWLLDIHILIDNIYLEMIACILIPSDADMTD